MTTTRSPKPWSRTVRSATAQCGCSSSARWCGWSGADPGHRASTIARASWVSIRRTGFARDALNLAGRSSPSGGRRRVSEVVLFVLDHGEDVPGGIGEPGDVGSVARHDAELVLRGVVVVQELHTLLTQLAHGGVDVVDGQVEHGERGRLVIVLGIEEHDGVAVEGELQESVAQLAHVEPEHVGVELA